MRLSLGVIRVLMVIGVIYMVEIVWEMIEECEGGIEEDKFVKEIRKVLLGR